MKKYLLLGFVFLSSFFLCNYVNASEFVRLSLENSYIMFDSENNNITFRSLPSDSNTNTTKLYLTRGYYQNTASYFPEVNAIYIELNNDGGFLAHKEYQFSLVMTPRETTGYSEPFPYLAYLPNDYSLDSNLLFTSKNVKFCQDSECLNNYFTREQMNLSYFSMGYSDNTVYNTYTINFTFVSPYPIDHLEFRLITNSSLVDSQNHKVWTLKNGNSIYIDFSKSMLVYDYYDFQGVPNDNICVGDECINHYEPDDTISSNPNINTNININSIISNAWSGLSSFASASIYILSLVGDLFLALPLEIRSLLLFCFSLGIIIILWKVLKI